jgi:hypothetical protein
MRITLGEMFDDFLYGDNYDRVSEITCNDDDSIKCLAEMFFKNNLDLEKFINYIGYDEIKRIMK